MSLCAGGGEGPAALHEAYAGGQSGLCAVPLVGLRRQEIPGCTGTPGRLAAGGTHTYGDATYTAVMFRYTNYRIKGQ